MKYPVAKIPPDRNSENAKAQNSAENSLKTGAGCIPTPFFLSGRE